MRQRILYQLFHCCDVYAETGSHGQTHDSVCVVWVYAGPLQVSDIYLCLMCLLQKRLQLFMFPILDGVKEAQPD